MDCSSVETCWRSQVPVKHLNDSDILPVLLFGSPKDLDKLTTSQLQENQAKVFECWAHLPTAATIVFTKDSKTSQVCRVSGLLNRGRAEMYPDRVRLPQHCSRVE